MNRATLFCAAALVLAAALFLVLDPADLFAQDGPFGGDGPGGRGMPPRMARMAGGGGVAMVTMNTNIFITNGRSLYKIDPVKMKVVETLELPAAKAGEKPRDRGEGRKGW
jgi:hypothetical protein